MVLKLEVKDMSERKKRRKKQVELEWLSYKEVEGPAHIIVRSM